VKSIRRALLDWYRANRRDLPWRRTRDPYAIWISETMLQQTRVETVIPYYERFLERFPDVAALADAESDDVLGAWAGLGYYSRARNLQAAARQIAERHGGRVPDDVEALRALPGIGRYTAGALASIAFDRPEPIVDGNVARVLARVKGIREDVKQPAVVKRLWEEAARLARGPAPGDLNQALMELGATVCVPGEPRCPACPLREDCAARLQGTQAMYPGRKARNARPLRQTCMLLAHVDGAVFLEKRPPSGIWGGLWSLPEVVDATLIDDWCYDKLSAKAESRTEWPILRHSFSHYDLDIRPVVLRLQCASAKVSDPAAGRFIPFGESEGVGLAAPVRKLVATLQQSGL